MEKCPVTTPDPTSIDNIVNGVKFQIKTGFPLSDNENTLNFASFRKGHVEIVQFFFHHVVIVIVACNSHRSFPPMCMKGSYDQKWKAHGRGGEGKEVFFKHVLWMGMHCWTRHKIFSFLSPFITVVYHPHTTTFSLFRQNVLVSARPPPMNCWSRQVTPTYLKSMKPIRAKSELIFTLFMDKKDPPLYQYLPFVNTAMINQRNFRIPRKEIK